MRTSRRVWRGAAGVVLVLWGCDGGDGLPPPRGSEGTAATSGGTTTTSTTDTAGPANVCECAAATSGARVACGDCVNAAIAPGAPCKEAGDACDNAGCTAISLCVGDCDGDAACQRACLFPDVEGPEHALYREVLACACAQCGSACTVPEPLECPAWGEGGGGGTGGGGNGAGGGGMGAGGIGGAGTGGA
ncbi:hypothetical protein [Chondromyces apiculatus]|uniref:hypothetical protein n=1 Tax=Chondromyces apiculatus TaxID=51 RepID=UPI0012DC2A3B|nr:hypothetical protein [Chondromyces apiculatus]